MIEYRTKNLLVRVNPEPAKAFLCQIGNFWQAERLRIKFNGSISGGRCDLLNSAIELGRTKIKSPDRARDHYARVLAHELVHFSRWSEYSFRELILKFGVWWALLVGIYEAIPLLVFADFVANISPLVMVLIHLFLVFVAGILAAQAAYLSNSEEIAARRIEKELSDWLLSNGAIKITEV